MKPIALVTGGSRGIGRAIVEELASTHTVVATYNSNLAAAEEVAKATGAIILPCQLGNAASCRQLLAELESRDLTAGVNESKGLLDQAQANFLARSDLSVRMSRLSDGLLVGSTGLHPIDWEVPSFAAARASLSKRARASSSTAPRAA